VDVGWNELIASLRTDVWTVADNGTKIFGKKKILAGRATSVSSGNCVDGRTYTHISNESEIAFTVIAFNTFIQIHSN
jgi:hypothetical protein